MWLAYDLKREKSLVGRREQASAGMRREPKWLSQVWYGRWQAEVWAEKLGGPFFRHLLILRHPMASSILYTDLLPLALRQLVTEMLYSYTSYETETTWFVGGRLATRHSHGRGDLVPYCEPEFPCYPWTDLWCVTRLTGNYTVKRHGPQGESQVEIVRRILRNKPRRKTVKMKTPPLHW